MISLSTSLLLKTLLVTLLIAYTNSYRVLKYSKYRCCSTSLKDANSPTVDLSNIDLLDYLQETKPSRTYNVMNDFRAAEFSGIDNKVLTFPKNSYPLEGMGYELIKNIESRIFIRKCYKEMYNLIMKMITNEDLKQRKRKFLITGTPGIGKSLFTLYFIKRYLDENNYSAPFGFQRDRGKADIITSDGNLYVDVADKFYRFEENLPFFCDGIDKFEPNGPKVPSLMIVTSSPDDARFKEYVKSNFVVTLTMPVWSREELDEMYDAFEMEAMHDTVIDIKYRNIVMRQSLYDVYGGVLRSIQSQDGTKMMTALDKKGSIVASNFFKAGDMPGTDIENSYTLVHLVPPKNEDDSYDYLHNIVDVASYYVYSVLRNISDIEAYRATKKFLLFSNPCGHYAALQGYLFEDLFYREHPAEMHLYALNKKGSSTAKIISNTTKTIKTPTDKYRPPEKVFMNWTSNVLYFPTSRTFESGDAFFIQGTKEQSELYIFQMTLAKTHAVKAKGLLKIVKYFEGSGYKIDSNSMKMHLVFVTPQKGSKKQMTNYQAIERMKDATSVVISKGEDDRITELFEYQAQCLSYFTITI